MAAPAPPKRKKSNASRKPRVPGISLTPTQDIPRTPYSVNHLRLPAFFELAAQAADMNIDDVRLRVVVIAPDLLEQHRARNDAAGVPHQIFETPVLARHTPNHPAGAPQLAGQ